MNDVKTPDRTIETRYGLFAAKTLMSAVELDLFSELDEEPLSKMEIEDRLGLHHRSSEDFLDALVALGFLEREDDLYSNTPESSKFLVRGKPNYMGSLLEITNNRLYEYWDSLSEALKTGKPQNELKNDGEANFFEKVYADDEKLKEFVTGMTGLSTGSAIELADRVDWDEFDTVCDIGTSEGVVPVTLVQEHDHLNAIGFDLPEVEKHFNAYVEKNGVSDRVTFQGGDFLEDPLPSADVLIIGHVLHDWGFDVKRSLLKKAYEALPEDGMLIVYGSIIDDERREHKFGLLKSLNLLIETPGGYTYTSEDGQRWMEEVGFKDTRTEELGRVTSMITARK